MIIIIIDYFVLFVCLRRVVVMSSFLELDRIEV